MMNLVIALSSFSSSLILSTKLFLLEIVPSIYFHLITPLPLFFLLNLLIISIFAIHLCKDAVATSTSQLKVRRSAFFSNHLLQDSLSDNYADNQAKLFAGLVLSDHDDAAAGESIPRYAHGVDADYARPAAAVRSDHLRRRGDHAVISGADPDLHDNLAVVGCSSADHTASERIKRGKDIEAVVIKAMIKMESDAADTDLLDYKLRVREDGDNAHTMQVSADDTEIHQLLISSLDPELAGRTQERPLASTRFIGKKTTNKTHLDMVRAHSPLKISRPCARRGDTIDATWKAICESRSRHSSPVARHHRTSCLKKVDHHVNAHESRDTNASNISSLSPSKQRHQVHTSSSSKFLMRKREPSMTRDELHARVESFISRFNQQIRIQREESLLNSRNMVDRGAN